jgi:formamidopyrimidine-DNA glycosylase
MPELPEVETSLRGIEPHLIDKTLTMVDIRQPKLRWPVQIDKVEALQGQRLIKLHRRAKYIIMTFESGFCLLVHLGMSGNVRIIHHTETGIESPQKHDHWDMEFTNSQHERVLLRYHDPRRFGALEIYHQDDEHNKQLDHLGPEPLTDAFSGELLFEKSRNKKQPVKLFIMDNKIVVGAGNIYANEALFKAGIRPDRAAGKISLKRYQLLSQCIKEVLAKAIKAGGTTLKDFTGGDGKPGYFQQELQVYGRKGEPCNVCKTELIEIRQGGRSTIYCKSCQR